MIQEQMKVVSQRGIARDIQELVLEGELALRVKNPGCFVHIRVSADTDPLLRRPISICEADPATGRLVLIYRVVGKGTVKLAEVHPGDKLDVLGPLGNGFPTEQVVPEERVLLVGGGVGVPPLYGLSKRLRERGITPVHVLGFANAQDAFYLDKFAALGPVYVATVDGSLGVRGMVTDAIDARSLECDLLYACGPGPMLKALEDRYLDKGIKGYLSLEQRMGCGIGACYACVCRTTGGREGGYRKVCSDGPVFKMGEVIL